MYMVSIQEYNNNFCLNLQRSIISNILENVSYHEADNHSLLI